MSLDIYDTASIVITTTGSQRSVTYLVDEREDGSQSSRKPRPEESWTPQMEYSGVIAVHLHNLFNTTEPNLAQHFLLNHSMEETRNITTNFTQHNPIYELTRKDSTTLKETAEQFENLPEGPNLGTIANKNLHIVGGQKNNNVIVKGYTTFSPISYATEGIRPLNREGNCVGYDSTLRNQIHSNRVNFRSNSVDPFQFREVYLDLHVDILEQPDEEYHWDFETGQAYIPTVPYQTTEPSKQPPKFEPNNCLVPVETPVHHDYNSFPLKNNEDDSSVEQVSQTFLYKEIDSLLESQPTTSSTTETPIERPHPQLKRPSSLTSSSRSDKSQKLNVAPQEDVLSIYAESDLSSIIESSNLGQSPPTATNSRAPLVSEKAPSLHESRHYVTRWLLENRPFNDAILHGLCKVHFAWKTCRAKEKCNWKHELPSDLPDKLRQLPLDHLKMLVEYSSENLQYFFTCTFDHFATVIFSKGAQEDLLDALRAILKVDGYERAPFVQIVVKILSAKTSFVRAIESLECCVGDFPFVSDILISLIVEEGDLLDCWNVLFRLMKTTEVDYGVLGDILEKIGCCPRPDINICSALCTDVLQHVDFKMILPESIVLFAQVLERMKLWSCLKIIHSKCRGRNQVAYNRMQMTPIGQEDMPDNNSVHLNGTVNIRNSRSSVQEVELKKNLWNNGSCGNEDNILKKSPKISKIQNCKDMHVIRPSDTNNNVCEITTDIRICPTFDNSTERESNFPKKAQEENNSQARNSLSGNSQNKSYAENIAQVRSIRSKNIQDGTFQNCALRDQNVQSEIEDARNLSQGSTGVANFPSCSGNDESNSSILHEDIPEKVDWKIREELRISHEDSQLIYKCIQNGLLRELVGLCEKYKHPPEAAEQFVAHIIATFTYIPETDPFRVFISLPKIFGKGTGPNRFGPLKYFLQVLGLNLIPILERTKRYKDASRIIVTFADDLTSFVAAKILDSKYKSLLSNSTKRYLYLCKVLTRGGELKHVPNIIVDTGILVRCNCGSVTVGVDCGRKTVVIEFLRRALELDEIFLAKRLIDHILYDAVCNSHYDVIWALNKMVQQMLENVPKYGDSLRSILDNLIQNWNKYVRAENVRALLVLFFNEMNFRQAMQLFKTACERNIYTSLTGGELQIQFPLNVEKSEVFLILYAYFLGIMTHKFPLNEVRVKLGTAMLRRLDIANFANERSRKVSWKVLVCEVLRENFHVQCNWSVDHDVVILDKKLVYSCFQAIRTGSITYKIQMTVP